MPPLEGGDMDSFVGTPAPAPEPAAPKPPTKPAASAEDPKPDPEEAKGRDWDSDDNPWKQRFDRVDKQYRETRDWATKVNADLEGLKRVAKRAEAKADGTYDPDADKDGEPTPEDKAAFAATQARVIASRDAAVRLYGEKAVQEFLSEDSEFSRKFGKDERVQTMLIADAAPVLAAMDFWSKEQFFEKYGRDPEKIKAAIRAEIEDEIIKKNGAGLVAKAARVAEQPNGVAGTRGAPAPDRDGAGNGAFVSPSLSSIFNSGIV